MTDFDPTLRRQLDLLVPATASAPNWSDVVARVHRPIWRRPLVVALAAALALVVTGAGITAAVGGFDRWLSGKPGKPAPAADQARFRAANGRSWAAFPTGTQLRQLINTTVGGKRYVLFGFRSGNELCLKLRAVTLGHTLGPACAPVSALVHLESPLLIVDGNAGLGDRYGHPSAVFSYGIVADGVTRVDVHAVDGTHGAVLGGNAFLWVENEPNTDNFVDRITAFGPGRRVTHVAVSEASILFGLQPTHVPGPTRIQHKIPHPAIGWYERGEPRGLSPAQVKLAPSQRRQLGLARLFKPDPLSDFVVGLTFTRNLCLVVVGNGEFCDTRKDFFSRGVAAMEFGAGSDGFSAVAGAVVDGITRVVIFSANGQRTEAALGDNLFTALVPGWTNRIVGYDSHGRVAGIEPFLGAISTPPAATLRHLRPVASVRAPYGAAATLLVGRTVRNVRCWRASFSTGQSQSGCLETNPTGAWTSVDGVQPAGRDIFVFGHVRVPVVRVRLLFGDGSAISAKPADGLFVFPIPRAHLSRTRQLAFVIGYDARGDRVQRQGVLFRQNP